jgi:LmbE family N-acetylglucosaminyl deacetylase
MLRLSLWPDGGRPLKLLCLGAHADDIEIGCGGTILRLLAEMPALVVRWIVFSAAGRREAEALSSASALLRGSADSQIEVLKFRDGCLPYSGADIKECFEAVRRDFDPSLILSHWRGDAHQDHRLVAELTHQTFRDHLVLEYEIPKYDGDLASPNVLVPLTRAQLRCKVEHIIEHFPSQQARGWFTEETFMAVARLRGIACNAPEGVAEGFHVAKAVL